jgi:probable F420-dependent oxidoreductase
MQVPASMRFGYSLPHRSMRPIELAVVADVAAQAEAVGFDDLWVTENTLDHAFSLEPLTALAFVAALTSRIRLGVSVIILPVHSPMHVAHQVASLDQLSKGRMILGVGLGRSTHYRDFQVPSERRVTRMTEGIELIKALWTRPAVDFEGQVFRLHDGTMALKPVQDPHPPIWMGGTHPDSIRRAAALADGWMGSGDQSFHEFRASAAALGTAVARLARSDKFEISKRVFVSVHERREVARQELDRWFREVYRKPELTDAAGLYGTLDDVREGVDSLERDGATHMLLNPVARFREHVELLGSLVAH